MSSARWHMPLDPSCPKVRDFSEGLITDPMSKYAPIDEIMERFEQDHRPTCKRCTIYGVAHIAAEPLQ